MEMRIARHIVIGAVAAVVLSALAAGSAAQDRPQVRTQADSIASCARLPAAQRDVCLLGRAMRDQDPDLCKAAKSQGCADMYAAAALPACYTYTGQRRLECELTVATRMDSVRVCRSVSDPDGCLVAVAAERKDISVILNATTDTRRRDNMFARYATIAGDDSVLARIVDPAIYNKAVVALTAAMSKKPGFDGRAWCRKIKPVPGDRPPDDNIGGTEANCRIAVVMAAQLTRALEGAEIEADRKRAVEMFARAVDAIAQSGLSADEVADQLDPGMKGPFAGRWTCPQRGTLTLRVAADDSVSGEVAGAAGEHWGGSQRKGGSITGTVNGNVLKLRMDSGDGTISNMDATLAANSMSFAGGWTWFRDKTQLGSGTWSCTRAK